MNFKCHLRIVIHPIKQFYCNSSVKIYTVCFLKIKLYIATSQKHLVFFKFLLYNRELNWQVVMYVTGIICVTADNHKTTHTRLTPTDKNDPESRLSDQLPLLPQKHSYQVPQTADGVMRKINGISYELKISKTEYKKLLKTKTQSFVDTTRSMKRSSSAISFNLQVTPMLVY